MYVVFVVVASSVNIFSSLFCLKYLLEHQAT